MPAAAEGFAELDVGVGEIAAGDGVLFFETEERALGVEDLEEIDLAGAVAETGETFGFACGGDGAVEGDEPFGGAADGDEGVFDFGEGAEDGGFVGGEGLLFESGASGDAGADSAGVEDGSG